MKIAHIENVTAVFGLVWTPLDGGITDTVTRAAPAAALSTPAPNTFTEDEPARAINVFVLKPRKGEGNGILGILYPENGAATFPRQDLPVLRRAVPAAAAIAWGGAKDGIYLMGFNDGPWWYCAVKNGSVIPGTDVVGERDQVLEFVAGLAPNLGLDVFVHHATARRALRRLPGAQPIDVEAIIAHARKIRMTYVDPRVVVVGVVTALAVIVVVGSLGGWYYHHQNVLAQQAMLQAAEKSSFLTSVKNAVGSYPADYDWPTVAMRKVREVAPPVMAGWIIDSVTCKPDACLVTYKLATGYGYMVTPFYNLFGKSSVTLMQGGRNLTVTVPLATQTVQINEQWMRSRPPATTDIADFVGTIGISMRDAKIAGAPRDQAVGTGQAAATMPHLHVNEVKVVSPNHLAPTALSSVLNAQEPTGFMPASINWSPLGLGWTIVWERVYASTSTLPTHPLHP